MPSPVIVTVGAVVNPNPGFIIFILETPVDEFGTSSNDTVLAVPPASKLPN